ncbi:MULTISPECIES: DUF6409 family protein [Streptomyces]|uniref:DUF6409 family protein n=1 Tax=Streptomyces TaxID=1883 RepID=UPI000B9E48FE|nr:DUF6409 family protein [Streptomyces kasugaensis]
MNNAMEHSTGKLVIAGPWRERRRLSNQPGIVVGPGGGGGNLLVWFWRLGAPEVGRTVQEMLPCELMPLDDTLTTMHPDAFTEIDRGFPEAWAIDGFDGEALRKVVDRAARERAASVTRRAQADG